MGREHWQEAGEAGSIPMFLNRYFEIVKIVHFMDAFKRLETEKKSCKCYMKKKSCKCYMKPIT